MAGIPNETMKQIGYPNKQGLYDPAYEHDSCGVGFVVHIDGKKSHDVVIQGLTILSNLSHRGAQGADPKTGDGAGILIQLPHEFFKSELSATGVKLPDPGLYAAGMVFLPDRPESAEFCRSVFEETAVGEGFKALVWRDVPLDNSRIGLTAREVQPLIRQVFLLKPSSIKDAQTFERRLYILRRLVEKKVAASFLEDRKSFYVLSLSSRTVVYKGLLMAGQLESFYRDLSDGRVSSALALVHSRYSTNTFPTWDLSQPFRFLAHNGEINTLRGNINWMTARQASLASPLFGDDIKKLFPVIVPGGSDSASLDNMAEFLLMSGRPLAHVMMMLMPEAWENDASLDETKKGFYEYHSALMEPWDGPAAVAFTDGVSIGAILDRNGLRPARYTVTKNGLVVMASETGVLDLKPEDILCKGRLQPGKMFLVDTVEGRIIDDAEIKKKIFASQPYCQWVKKGVVRLEDLASKQGPAPIKEEELLKQQLAFGYTREDIKIIMVPMAETALEPTGSMGSDMPLAVLSNYPQSIYNYFKQLFAQVTNPPIDSIREGVVMSIEGFLGKQLNLCAQSDRHCELIKYRQPVLSNEELAKLRFIDSNGFRAKTLSILFDLKKSCLGSAVERICREASQCL